MNSGDTFHPLLAEDLANATKANPEPMSSGDAPAPAAPSPSEAAQAAPPAPPAPAAETVDPSVSEDQFKIVLDRRSLYPEFMTRYSSDPEFRNVVSTAIGRRNRREYDANVAVLKAELEEARQKAKDAEDKAARLEFAEKLAKMSEAEIQTQYDTDPTFAAQYTAHRHPELRPSPTPEERPNPAAARVEAYRAEQVESMFDQADEVLIPPERQALYRQAFSGCSRCNTDKHSLYDHVNPQATDPEEFKKLHITQLGGDRSLAMQARIDTFRRLFGSEIEMVRKAIADGRWGPGRSSPPPAGQPAQSDPPAAAAPVAAPAAADAAGNPNPALSRQAPVMTRPTGSPPQVHQLSRADYSAMDPEERIKRWPNDGDFERAVLAGEVEAPEGMDLDNYRSAVAAGSRT